MKATDNKDVERVAVSICDNLGLNAYEMVMEHNMESSTPLESKDQTYTFDVCMYVQRWENYRRKAALAIASYQAVKENT